MAIWPSVSINAISILHFSRESRTDGVQKAGPVLRDHLKRAGGEHSLSNSILVSTFTLDGPILRPHAILQHAFEIRFSMQHIVNAVFEAFPFRQIQFQRAEAVRKIELVHDDSRVIRKCGCLLNIHAPRGRARRPSGQKGKDGRG